MAKLQTTLSDISLQARQGEAAIQDVALDHVMQRDVPTQILRTIAEAMGECPPATTTKRELSLQRALAYIKRWWHHFFTVHHGLNVLFVLSLDGKNVVKLVFLLQAPRNHLELR